MSIRLLTIFTLIAANINVVLAADKFATGGLHATCSTYPAVAMTPYNESTQNNLYRMTHERVYHQPGKTGMILLYGNIQRQPYSYGSQYTLKATFRDPDGPGTNARVIAELRFVGPGGIKIIKTLDSNKHAWATNDVQTMSAPVYWHETNRSDGYYVVRMYIIRSSADIQPVAFGYNFCLGSF